jgi:hypothetical protein
MYLHYRSGNGSQGICNGYGSVGKTGCIEYYTIISETHRMQLVNNVALMIGLVIMEVYLRKKYLKLIKKTVKGAVAIDFGLPQSQQVQVWPIDDNDLNHVRLIVVITCHNTSQPE